MIRMFLFNLFWDHIIVWLILCGILILQLPIELFVALFLIILLPITLPISLIIASFTGDFHCVLVIFAPAFYISYYIYEILKKIILWPITIGESLYKISLQYYVKKMNQYDKDEPDIN